MKRTKVLKTFAKFLAYILEHNPYEFGLIPDKDGFIKIRDLLQAINEEEGWRHIKKSHIDELAYSLPEAGILVNETHIKSNNSVHYNKPIYAGIMPGEIYTPIRTKAHYHALTKGLSPSGGGYVILTSRPEVAEKIGRRKDKSPVVLSINSDQAEQAGVMFYKAGNEIFLAGFIPPESITGPPLPEKLKAEILQESRKSSGNRSQKPPPVPGSYIPDPEKTVNIPSAKSGKRDKKSWKQNKKKLRRQAAKFNSNF